ncbi:phospholipase [Actinoplanes palleronii]|uniref:Phospholipase A2 n=1 Tax=Actinoplanes palleronii TaxID=113570 RepID=A0ABQ4BLD0_9ACTN|nr:phospholipase [Actinoplanes palleronii]GIE71479.1 hypothetical protein Apa02nite_075870 [Actinoplanes palleronii]
MSVRRSLAALTTVAAVTLGLTGPAYAATAPDRLAVLASFTQTGAGSYQDWNAARQNRDKWADYHFDWGTDYCSASPDRPLGYDFHLACWRHDFGYRNYKDAGAFTPAAKDRIDVALYADLKRKCATYAIAARPPCYTLAWVYYRAVVIFGFLGPIDPDEVVNAGGAR